MELKTHGEEGSDGWQAGVRNRFAQIQSQEELLNTLTHVLGLGVAAIAAIWLVPAMGRASDTSLALAAALYYAVVVAQFAASVAYHAASEDDLKQRLKLVDHAIIYLVMAGLYTPFGAAHLQTTEEWSRFGGVWALASLGAASRFWFANLSEGQSLLKYFAIGLASLALVAPTLGSMPSDVVKMQGVAVCCVVGGLAFYVADRRIPGSHAIWHLCVVAAAVFSLRALWLFLEPLT